jgi:hypothetical protein
MAHPIERDSDNYPSSYMYTESELVQTWNPKAGGFATLEVEHAEAA